MKITEGHIEKAILDLEHNAGAAEKIMKQFESEQPDLFNFIFEETCDALTEEEANYLAFLAISIYKACKLSLGEIEAVDGEEIEAADEKNWEKLNEFADYQKTIDFFYDNAEEKDLIALIDDSISPANDGEEEEIPISAAGIELMLTSLKTLVDVLIPSIPSQE